MTNETNTIANIKEAEDVMIEALIHGGLTSYDTVEEARNDGYLEHIYDVTCELGTYTAMNGRKVLWYMDSQDLTDRDTEVAVYIDTLEELTDEEIKEQLYPAVGIEIEEEPEDEDDED